MAAGLEPEMSAAFPLGKAENNYTIQVNVKVMDAYMLSTETFFTVRVSGNLHFTVCVPTSLSCKGEVIEHTKGMLNCHHNG